MPLGPGPAHAALLSGAQLSAAVAVDDVEDVRVEGETQAGDAPDQVELPEPKAAPGAPNPKERATPEPMAVDRSRQVHLDPGGLVPEIELVRPLHTRRWVLEWLTVIAGALLVALVVKVLFFQAFVIPSGSMIPTLQIGDRVLVNKLTYDREDMKRGDIVVFRRPVAAVNQVDPSDDSDLIKRLMGLPGETLEGREDGIYVNNVKIEQPWLPEGTPVAIFGPVTLADNEIFMMGDNRGASSDSRVFGPVNIDLVVGEALIRVWPPNNLGPL